MTTTPARYARWQAVAKRSRVACLDILVYSLSTSLFLNLSDSRRAFGKLMGKTFALLSARANNDSTHDAVDAVLSEEYQQQKWYKDMLIASSQEARISED